MRKAVTEKILKLFEYRFGVTLELFPSTHFEESSVRTDIVCLPENEISFSAALNEYIYAFRIFNGQKYIALLKGEHDTLKDEGLALQLLLETTICPLVAQSEKSKALEAETHSLELQLEKPQTETAATTDFETQHLIFVGTHFDNLKLALAAHEASQRLGFIRVESEKELSLLSLMPAKHEQTTIFISLELKDKVLQNPALCRRLKMSPLESGQWFIFSAVYTEQINGLPLENCYVHLRQNRHLHLVESEASPQSKGLLH